MVLCSVWPDQISVNATLDGFLTLQEPSDYPGYFLVTILLFFKKLYSPLCLSSSDIGIYGMNIYLRGI